MTDQRRKFDTLFADPRHYRGDCRLMRTAIRQGWLNNAPQPDRDALVARFEQATRERREADPDGQSVRRLLAECRVVLELERANQVPMLRTLRYTWAGALTGRTGRPRERWHVSDYPNRIDANELRRRAKAEGLNLPTVHAIDLWPADAPEDARERVALAVALDARYRWRLWLVCPRCKCRRVHLYRTRANVRCRKCAGLNYASLRRRRGEIDR
jgi:hypothetical protein